MTHFRMSRFAALCSLAIVPLALLTTSARAQVAPIPFWNSGGPSFFVGSEETQFWGAAPDEDGFRKGFSFRSFSSSASSFGTGLGGIGAFAGGLSATGAQYGYSFKGLGDTPVTLFGGINSLRTTPDVFTAITTPGFETSRTLSTGFNTGVEFKPTSNLSLSLSAGYVQPSAPVDTDLRSQMLSAQQPRFWAVGGSDGRHDRV